MMKTKRKVLVMFEHNGNTHIEQHDSKCINEILCLDKKVKGSVTKTIHAMNDDLTLIWRDGKLVEQMKVTLKEHKIEFGYKDKLVYSKDIESLDDFKSSFLKRLGNIKGSSNKSNKEYQKIKPIVKSGNSIKEIAEEINRLYRWNIEIKG